MPDFPQLRTGVVIQYPARRQYSFATRVLTFVDGTEQRFRISPAVLRSWVIRLNLLTEDELSNLREFFRSQAGEAQTFSFTDPWDDVEYENCTFEGDAFEAILRGEGQGDVNLIVRESR